MYSLVYAAKSNHINAEKGEIEQDHDGHEPILEFVANDEMLGEQIHCRNIEETRAISMTAGVSELQVFTVFNVDGAVDHQRSGLSQNTLHRLRDENEEAHLGTSDEGVCLVLEMVRYLDAQPKSRFVTQMRNG